MRFLHVSCGELKMTTWKTSKVWDYFELEGNGKVLCKLCNVKLAYNSFTGAMRNHIQYRHVCVSLEASQSQMSIMSYTTTCHDPIRAVYSSKRRPTSVVVQDFQALFETVCLLVVISLCACDFSSCRALFFFFVKCRIASSPVFCQTTLTC